MNPLIEKKLLQGAVAVACLVPLGFGASGVVLGTEMFGGANEDVDNQFRYLSGVLFGIGLLFVSVIPKIENNGERMRLLVALVVIGGLGRLLGSFISGVMDGKIIFALAMELAVAPLLYLWQCRIRKKDALNDRAA